MLTTKSLGGNAPDVAGIGPEDWSSHLAHGVFEHGAVVGGQRIGEMPLTRGDGFTDGVKVEVVTRRTNEVIDRLVGDVQPVGHAVRHGVGLGPDHLGP